MVAARPRGARRQPPAVLQPGHRHADQRRPRRVRRRRLRRLPVADGIRRLRPGGQRRQARRHPRDDPHRRRLLLRPERPHVDHRVPGRRAAEGAGGLRRHHPRRHGAGHRRALPEVPAPRLPRPVVRHERLVRVPVPRLAVQPRRREEGRPGATRHGPLPGHRRRQRRRHRRHRHRRPRARRSARTPPARRPRARTASPAEASTDDRARDDVDRLDHPRRHRRRLDRLRRAQRRLGPQGGRLRDRAGAQPQAVLRRRGARGPAAGARAALRRAAPRRHRHRPAAVLDLRARPAGRRPGGHGEAARRLGRAIFSPTGDNGGVQLRRLPRRHERHRRRGAVHGHRPGHRRGQGRSSGTRRR